MPVTTPGLVQHLDDTASDIPFGMGAASPGAGVCTMRKECAG